MSGFLFQTTRSIMCEIGAARKTGTIMQNLGCRHVMVVTDRGIVGAGLLDRVTQSLEAAGIRATVFDAVEADPSQEMVLEAAHSAKSQKCDGVLGLGGGSPMDVAKLVSLLNGPGCSQTLEEMYGVHNAKGGRLPMIQVPTTAGTGSEVTPIAIITTGKNTKKGVVSPTLYPDWAVLDGELTLTVPPHVTAATGIDAMVCVLLARSYRSCFVCPFFLM
jgi:alcohol dehydrogenase